MKIGVIFPQTEIGTDPIAIRDYAAAAEEAGYDHLVAYDHVIGANPASRPGWKPPYDHRSIFHEPFVLFGFLAAVTMRLELVTGIVILPQRQTVLVAKQAAAVDVLSRGRLRLGVGIGWNPVEYEALGENFSNRGRRSEEQVALLRLLWSRELVNFEGKWHKISDAGINPLPIRRSIPIWFGGNAEPVLKRVGQIGDGWFPLLPPNDKCRAMIQKIRQYGADAGRNIADIGIEGRIMHGHGAADGWVEEAVKWKNLGATHICLNTMKSDLPNPSAHIAAIQRFKEAIAGVDL